ncbi:threonine--tRNA ligase [Candidatus Beckwithbacteria bacterium CG10_big_fil_rev_8_21_14_0_10_34_10]|uniref:Threonine--tRNA ligase n=1 Tax=Candidatus Beckwithbacteria bacterium CG10_big_fil_rev_8_21_14_0_10_34_10 TaxID=1974495 RepID=A0A2H0WAN1_9BACT|nr:MAG: threonine--tRNA ligase [Candidatus Beckwithbacteria bacterium CG10_big_fil_rev_8_21_14_0_10_34_10]
MNKAKNNLLKTMRHSCEHILHQAVVELFPGLKRAMGPATDEGFYLDFDYQEKIAESDFPKIEKRMREIIKADLPIIRKVISLPEARKLFKNNPYKQEWLLEIEKKGEKATVYWTGKPNLPGSDVDLCKGPHVQSTGRIGPFKLLSVAGAYWHGDEKNKMLTRIYGTCFKTKKDLDKYLWQIEEAKKRDHRVLGQKLELFMFDDEVGQGLPLYLPKGAMIRHLLMDFALKTYLKNGYELVSTPHIGSESLWQRSGHLKFYAESMYGPMEVEGKKYRLKPMNCPFQVKMYTAKIRSYKELPIRWTEMGTVYRYEKSGELHGLTRPRGFTQDDAHIICTPKQLEAEIKAALEITSYMYKTLKMDKLIYKLSVRDPQKLSKYFGQAQDWNQAEETLKKVLVGLGHEHYEVDVGGAVFYAPKIDIDGVDSLGRRWQLSTVQIDFNLPAKFQMKYIDKDGQEKTPFMIHRALLGSIERFLGVYIEHTAGAFPLWLSPVQVKIIPISRKHLAYSKKLSARLKANSIRVEINDKDATMQKKIKEAEEEKIPYMLVIGDREVKENIVSVRKRGKKDLETMKVEKFLSKIKTEIEEKS